jgi:hypothetical protein
MCQAYIQDFRDELPWCRLANEQPNLFECCRCPRAEDEQTYENGTKRIEPPYEPSAHDGHDQTKGIDYNVIPMVDEEHATSWITSKKEAIDHQATFRED